MTPFLRIVITGIIGFAGFGVLWELGFMRTYTRDQVFVMQIAFMFLFAGAATVSILWDVIHTAINGSPDDSSEEEAEGVPVPPAPTLTEVKMESVKAPSEPISFKLLGTVGILLVAGVMALFAFNGGVWYHLEKIWYMARDIFFNEEVPLEILMRESIIVTAIGFVVLLVVAIYAFSIMALILAAVVLDVLRWISGRIRGDDGASDPMDYLGEG